MIIYRKSKTRPKIQYRVRTESSGFTYVVPKVYERRHIFFGLIPYWKSVWEGEAKNAIHSSKMLPESKLAWCEETIEAWEKYNLAWQKFESNNNS